MSSERWRVSIAVLEGGPETEPPVCQGWWKESCKHHPPASPPLPADRGQCPHFTEEESRTQEKRIGLRLNRLARGKASI